jgi:hypothetical protein
MNKLSEISTSMYAIFQPLLENKKLAQAVIDDNRERVNGMLKAKPELLLTLLPNNFTIVSQHTWQRFDLSEETLLSIAVKRHQLEMINNMWSYLDMLEQIDFKKWGGTVRVAKEAVFTYWDAYEFYTDEDGNNCIVISNEYAKSCVIL